MRLRSFITPPVVLVIRGSADREQEIGLGLRERGYSLQAGIENLNWSDA